MQEQTIVEQEAEQLPNILSEPIIKEIRRVQLACRLDSAHNPESLELGVREWSTLTDLLFQNGDKWRACLTNDPPMLWGMRLVAVPNSSGLMVK